MPSSAHAGNQGPARDSQLNSRRQLIIRPGAIGDTIVSLPALEHLRRGFEGDTEIWVSAACVPLIGFADRVRAISATGLDLLELGLETPARAALASFGQIVSWYGAGRAEFRDTVRHLPFTFHTALPGSACHAVDFYLSQVGAPAGGVPSIRVDNVQRRNFIACHPFSGGAKKNWPLERFPELVTSLPIEFCAGPEDPDLPGAHRFESLEQVAAWLASARAYVGNDSGITHLAAAVGTPVVAIFRASDPAVWAPRGIGRVLLVAGESPDVADVRDAIASLLR